MKHTEKILERTLLPAFCFGLGAFWVLLPIFLVTVDNVTEVIRFFSIDSPPDHLLTQIVCWLRYFCIFTGLAFLTSAFLWKPFFRKVLADERFEKWGEKGICIGLLAATLPAYLLLEWFVFHRLPLSADEFSYLYQAKIFSSGKLSVSAHPVQEFFTSAFIAHKDGRLFSIMPPGWPLLLAPWTWIHASWCVNPILSSLCVVLLFLLGKAMFNRTIGFLAAFLMAVSPFFLYMSGTFFSHPLCLFLILLFTYGYVRMEKGGMNWSGVVFMGLGLAGIPFVHHFDIFILFPILIYLGVSFFRGIPFRRGKIFVMGACSIMILLTATLLYNNALTGNPLAPPHLSYLDDGNFLGEIPPDGSLIGVSSMKVFNERLLRVVNQAVKINIVLFPFAPAFVLLPFFLPGRSRWDFFLMGGVLTMIVAYLFYLPSGGLQLGPRYYYPGVGYFYLLVCRSLWLLHGWMVKTGLPRWRQGAVSFFLLLVVSYQIGFSAATLRMISYITDSAKAVENAGACFKAKNIGESLIFLKVEENAAMASTLLYNCVRNEPDFSDMHLTVLDRGLENGRLMDFYPSRRYFLYEVNLDRLARGKPMRWPHSPQPLEK